jgi:serine protease Do
MNRRRYLATLAVALTLGIGILIGTIISRNAGAARGSAPAPDAALLPPPSPVNLSNSFAAIAEKVGPAVVNINTESTVRFTAKRGGRGDWEHWFHLGPFDAPPEGFEQQNLGSGMILDKNGYILTNYHVIMREGEDRQADRMRVHLRDDDDTKFYPARVVGADKLTDLAVIKIEAGRPLPTVQLGDSDSIRVGDWVLAIGSPFGLNATVTAGIISAKGRDIERDRDSEFKRFLQTDAAINPGNSGGPLVNLAGQVVGVNTAIATSHGAYDGVGFAIPSNTARKVYNALVSSGAVHRGAIGVTFSAVRNAALLRAFHADHGVVIDQVEPNSPAERAGLRQGDVIVAVDSKRIDNGDELLQVISETEPGKRLRIDYLRDGRTSSADVVVGDWNKIAGETVDEAAEPPEKESPHQPGSGPLGVSVKNLTPEEMRELARSIRTSAPAGVEVSEVGPGSFADDLGLRRTDIILSLNHQPVRSVEEFNRLQAPLKQGDDVLLFIARPAGRRFVTLFLANTLP